MKGVVVGKKIGDREASWRSGQGTGSKELLRLVSGNEVSG